MSKINAFKMHGLGNQFLIIDRRTKDIELSKHQIQKISSNTSTKFDQLLFLEKDLDDIVPIRIFNSNSQIGTASTVQVGPTTSTTDIHRFVLKRHSTRVLDADKILRKFPLSQNLFVPSQQDVPTNDIGML